MVHFTLIPVTTPSGRYSHQMIAQKREQPLFTDFGVPSSVLFGNDSLFIHGG